MLSRLFRIGGYASVAMIFGGAVVIGPTRGSSSDAPAPATDTQVAPAAMSSREPRIVEAPQATPALKDSGPLVSERFSRVVVSNGVNVESPAASTDEAWSPGESAAAENAERATEGITSEETGSVEPGTADG